MNVNPKKRTEFIGLRCQPEEKELLTKIAKDMGIPVTKLLIFGAMYFGHMYYKNVRNI